MKTLVVGALIVTSVLLFPAVQAAQLQDKGPAKVIEYYGDSTIWGFKSGTGERVVKPAPQVFAETIAGPQKFTVRNEGVNGTTACQLLEGTDGVHKAWGVQMASSRANYVILSFGINDQWKYDVGTYRSCLQSLIRIAKQLGKQIIFETPNPTRDSGPEGLDVYVNAMRNVAEHEGVPVIDQYRYLSSYLAGRPISSIVPDGLHPSEAVYALKGKYAAAVFAEIVQRSGSRN